MKLSKQLLAFVIVATIISPIYEGKAEPPSLPPGIPLDGEIGKLGSSVDERDSRTSRVASKASKADDISHYTLKVPFKNAHGVVTGHFLCESKRDKNPVFQEISSGKVIKIIRNSDGSAHPENGDISMIALVIAPTVCETKDAVCLVPRCDKKD